jgi:CheY-like chemotaxis protein
MTPAASCRLLAALLAPDDYDVRTVDDGADALWLIRADPPDLILMDVVMPGVDGFQACRAIKQDPSTWLIPVVARLRARCNDQPAPWD